MTDREQPEALRLADYLENGPVQKYDRYGFVTAWEDYCPCDEAAAELRRLYEENKTLRDRLAQPEPEPVAWQDKYGMSMMLHDDFDGIRPLYTAPPKREWVGLTDEELFEIGAQHYGKTMNVILAVQSKLKHKNT